MTLYTPSEAGAWLKLKPITVIRLFDSGALSGVILRAGKRKRIIRFKEDAIEKFIASREKRASKAGA